MVWRCCGGILEMGSLGLRRLRERAGLGLVVLLLLLVVLFLVLVLLSLLLFGVLVEEVCGAFGVGLGRLVVGVGADVEGARAAGRRVLLDSTLEVRWRAAGQALGVRVGEAGGEDV